MIPAAVRPDARYRIVDEGRIVDLIVLNGYARESPAWGREQATRDAREALGRWIAAGLPFARSQDGTRRFDPAEVLNFMKFIGARDGDPFWEQCFVATARGIILEFHHSDHAAAVPPSPTALPSQPFRVAFEREFDLDGGERGARTLLRLPLPLEDHTLRDLKVVTVAPPQVEVEFTVAPGRLDARLAGTHRGAITLGVELSFNAYPTVATPTSTSLAAPEIDLYTRWAEGLINVSPRVQALAAKLAGNLAESRAAVMRFWSFMLDELTIGVLHYDELNPAHPIDWVLESGWYDCQMGSALLIALCRARGIPARMASGYFLYPASPTPHYWVEVWLDHAGWTSLDTICADLSVGGRDAPWRDYFFGCLDYRMKTQCLPRVFNHNPGMPFPPAWHMLTSADGMGIDVSFFANDTGTLVYRDRIAVRYGASAMP